MTAIQPNITTNHSAPLPYLACLMPGVSMETQGRLRFISNSVLLPLDITFAILSFLGNVFLLIAVARLKTRMHPSLIHFCGLSVSDLIWAMFVFYRDVRKSVHVHMCPPNREEETYLAIFCIFATFGNLASISKDRCCAITRPLWYRSHMTKSRALRQALISWLWSITTLIVVILVVKLLPENFLFITKAIGVIFCVACCVTIIVCYVKIFLANLGHRDNIQQYGARPSAAALKRERQVATTVGLIILVLVLTHLPALATPVALSVLGYGSKAPYRPFFTIFITLNGLLSPIINCRRNKAIQRSFRLLIGCQCRIKLVPSATARNPRLSLGTDTGTHQREHAA